MSSAITTVGQTRINQLRGAEQPLIIDRMILALIPGLDSTLAVDRSQQLPQVEQIVHTATINANHKGYVDPDQVVYSIILGSDVGDFSFNWIGLIEATTDTVIAVTTTPETPKRKTNLGNNTTGNNITRNFMIQFLDAQNVTGVTVAAETWQFDYQADFTSHENLVVDPTQVGTEKKHVTDTQAKVWQDHTETPHDFVLSVGGQGVDNTDPENPIVRMGSTSEYGVLAQICGVSQIEEPPTGPFAVPPAILKAWLSKRSFSANDFIRIPDVAGGLIIQWGSFNTGSIGNEATGIQSFPLTFPHLACAVIVGSTAGVVKGDYMMEGFTVTDYTPSQFMWISKWELRNDTYSPIQYIAVGY